MSTAQRPVLVALGNAFRGDDGVGAALVEQLQETPHLDIVRGVADSLSLLNAWAGAPLAIIVDAAQSGARPGTIRQFDMQVDAIPHAIGRCSSHGLGVADALALGHALGRLPERMVIYAIEAKSFEQGTPLSAEVSAAIPRLKKSITELLERENSPA